MSWRRRMSVSVGLFLFGFSCAVMLPEDVRAACGQDAITAAGYFFLPQETFERGEEGYPIYRFAVTERFVDGRPFILRWGAFNDECQNSFAPLGSASIHLPAGASRWSARFTSISSFEVWDDIREARVTSYTLPSVPDYSHVVLRGNIDGSASTFSSSIQKLKLGVEPPVRVDTLPPPPACSPGVALGYFFDSYERAEYVEGLLRVHMRLRSPYNDGRLFMSATTVTDEECSVSGPTLRSLNTAFPPYMRYFSFRMMSPTSWELWDDEREEPIVCTSCAGNISEEAKLVFWRALIDGSASRISTTPFPPVEEGCRERCFSNVLFLPGLQASRLYAADGEELWPPAPRGLNDISRLAFSSGGAPVEAGIYAGDILRETYGTSIYASFSDMMDGLVLDGTIAAWRAFPYDWRYSVQAIVEGRTARASGASESLLEEIEELAASSKSGKVILVAHSNGGLVGKLALKRLEEAGKGSLVDKLVMVGTPQLGTPKSLFVLLHGEGFPTEGLPFLFSKETSRTLAEHLPGAYGLLPSSRYFNTVLDPVAEFDSLTSLTSAFRNAFGLGINSFAEFEGFVSGSEGRAKPSGSDLYTPNILNGVLFDQAEALHAELDGWSPAEAEIIEVAGWGVPTLRGISYAQRNFPFGTCDINCAFLDHEPIFTVDGDKTVVSPSARQLSTGNFYFNLKRYSADKRGNYAHLNIFETEPITTFVKNLIQEDESLPQYISALKPIPNVLDTPSLRLKVHSPVSLHIYDSQGRHTGIATNTPYGTILEEQVPGSYYFEIGEGKYAGASPESGVQVVLYGEGSGTFTFEAEAVAGDDVQTAAVFLGIPIVAGAVASLDISSGVPASTLVLDMDADGAPDAAVSPGEGVSPAELLQVLSGFVQTLNLPEKREKRLLSRIGKLEKVLEREYKKEWRKKQRTKLAFKLILDLIARYEKKKFLSAEEALELRTMVENIKNLVII